MLVGTKHLKQPPAAEMDREQVIRAVLEEIRPNLKRDGGDCQLVAIDGTQNHGQADRGLCALQAISCNA